MAARFIDIHPHIISADPGRYPRIPLFGVQSDWSQERPVTLEGLSSAMDEAGVHKPRSCNRPPATVMTTPMSWTQLQAPSRPLYRRGLRGRLRSRTLASAVRTGSAAASRACGSLPAAARPRSTPARSMIPVPFPAWELCGELGLSMCIQTDPSGLAQVAGLAKRFPKVRIVLDHLGRPDISDGSPYRKASSLFGLAPFENIFLKLTPRIIGDAQRGQASADTFFPRLVSVFGSDRLAWGSNFPASEGKLADNLAKARKSLACLSTEDQAWIFGRTAQHIYPALAANTPKP